MHQVIFFGCSNCRTCGMSNKNIYQVSTIATTEVLTFEDHHDCGFYASVLLTIKAVVPTLYYFCRIDDSPFKC